LTRDGSGKDRRGRIAIQTNPLDGLEAVVFDLDGTLCRYAISVEEVFRAALPRAGIDPDVLGDPAEAAAEYARLWSEVQATLESTERIRLHIIERLLGGERGVDDATRAARLSDAYGAVRDETGIRAFEGAGELLEELKGRYALGLLTNGPSDMQWEKIRSLGFGRAFDAIVVAGDVGIYKPDRRAFEALLARLDVRPSSALFVGDNHELDIVGAHRAGMRTAWVKRDGARPGEDVVPDIEIDGVTALREVLL
jgi:2-haloalkanoic acid dehalogenase type II